MQERFDSHKCRSDDVGIVATLRHAPLASPIGIIEQSFNSALYFRVRAVPKPLHVTYRPVSDHS